MMNGNEVVLDSVQWRVEAQGQIKDIEKHAKFVSISESLGSDDRGVYFNLTTLEDLQFCIHLSPHGFKVMGDSHDSMTGTSEYCGSSFETPCALMTVISPGYQQSVGNELLHQLMKLSEQESKE